MSIIYKATNEINGKSYIGFTKGSLHKRRREHLSSSECSKSQNYNCHFTRAIRKHGWENFKWEVLFECEDADYCLLVKEPEFIAKYNTFKNGYNMTIGGEGSLHYKHTPEMIEANRQRALKNKSRPPSRECKWELWKIGNPEDKLIVTSLKKFCRDQNFSDYGLYMVAKGKYKQHNGWVARKVISDDSSDNSTKQF